MLVCEAMATLLNKKHNVTPGLSERLKKESDRFKNLEQRQAFEEVPGCKISSRPPKVARQDYIVKVELMATNPTIRDLIIEVALELGFEHQHGAAQPTLLEQELSDYQKAIAIDRAAT